MSTVVDGMNRWTLPVVEEMDYQALGAERGLRNNSLSSGTPVLLLRARTTDAEAAEAA